MNVTTSNVQSILNTARKHKRKNKYGKASSYYLWLFQNENNYCSSLKLEFLEIFTNWSATLMQIDTLKSFFSYLETCLMVCQPIKNEILLAATEVLFNFENVLEAKKSSLHVIRKATPQTIVLLLKKD